MKHAINPMDDLELLTDFLTDFITQIKNIF